jgi:hypothetical protein
MDIVEGVYSLVTTPCVRQLPIMVGYEIARFAVLLLEGELVVSGELVLPNRVTPYIAEEQSSALIVQGYSRYISGCEDMPQNRSCLGIETVGP